MLDDVAASDEDRRIAAEELVHAGDRLRPPPALRADEERAEVVALTRIIDPTQVVPEDEG